jgi:hypothetical protein
MDDRDLKKSRIERRGRNVQDGLEPPFGIRSVIRMPWMLALPDPYSHYAPL